MKEPARVYQIKITLDEIQPPIWRRVLISEKTDLLTLHDVIQRIMPWQDYHLHEFVINKTRYGNPEDDETDQYNVQEEIGMTLKKLALAEGAQFTYEYDFGDGWTHTLLVEKVFPQEKGMRLPACTGGEHACPPEDSGGFGGYVELLEALSDPENEEHDQLMEWVGGEFNPETFDLEGTNARLHAGASRDWSGFTIEEVEELAQQQRSLLDPMHWGRFRRPDWEDTARNLPLRQDVATLITYIRDHKVTGTQSTGNLPRKAVEEIAAKFYEPPTLEEKFGDQVFRFRSEEDIWPVYFAHLLAHAAALLEGGPGRIWKLTPTGEDFLALPAVAQVWDLFITWWYRINWSISFPIGGFSQLSLEEMRQTVASRFKELPVEDPVEFEPLAKQLCEDTGITLPESEPDNAAMILTSGIDEMLIDPLESLGVLAVERKEESRYGLEIQKAVTLRVTEFGRNLLEAV